MNRALAPAGFPFVLSESKLAFFRCFSPAHCLSPTWILFLSSLDNVRRIRFRAIRQRPYVWRLASASADVLPINSIQTCTIKIVIRILKSAYIIFQECGRFTPTKIKYPPPPRNSRFLLPPWADNRMYLNQLANVPYVPTSKQRPPK